MKHGLLSLALLVPSLAVAQAPPPAAKPEVIALKAARLFDGTKETTVANGVVIVENGKIKAAGSGLAVPAGARVIDLGDATLLPGFIDAHVHITGESGDNWHIDAINSLRQTVPEQSIRATVLARRTETRNDEIVCSLPASVRRRYKRILRLASTPRRKQPTRSPGPLLSFPAP